MIFNAKIIEKDLASYPRKDLLCQNLAKKRVYDKWSNLNKKDSQWDKENINLPSPLQKT